MRSKRAWTHRAVRWVVGCTWAACTSHARPDPAACPPCRLVHAKPLPCRSSSQRRSEKGGALLRAGGQERRLRLRSVRRGSCRQRGGRQGRRSRQSPAHATACRGEKRRAHCVISLLGPPRPPPDHSPECMASGGSHPTLAGDAPAGPFTARGRSAAAAALVEVCTCPEASPLPPPRRPSSRRPPAALHTHGRRPAAAPHPQIMGLWRAAADREQCMGRCCRCGSRRQRGGRQGPKCRHSPTYATACHEHKRRAHRISSL